MDKIYEEIKGTLILKGHEMCLIFFGKEQSMETFKIGDELIFDILDINM